MMNSENIIDNLTNLLSKLPGFGKRSARRAVLHMIKNKQNLMIPLADIIKETANSIVNCELCGNIDVKSPCNICCNPKRDKSVICIIEEVADLWAIERSNNYRGLYHVLGGVLSAIDGVTPEKLNIESLIHNINSNDIAEIIMATSATIDGQTTAYFLTNLINENTDKNIKITRLAQGIPIGGEIDYLDDSTLGAAFNSRLPFAES